MPETLTFEQAQEPESLTFEAAKSPDSLTFEEALKPEQAPWQALKQEGTKGIGRVLKGAGAFLESVSPMPTAEFPDPRAEQLQQEIAQAHAAQTPAQRLRNIQTNPLYVGGQALEEVAPEVHPVTPAQERGKLTQLGGTVGGFVPLIASGPLAPVSIGLESMGEHVSADYDNAKAQGLDDDKAAEVALNKAYASGALQAGVFAVLPAPVRGALEKYLVNKLGKEGFARWLTGRVAAGTEGAVLGGTSAAAENVVEGEPITKGVGGSAGGLAAMNLLLPWLRGRGQEATPEVKTRPTPNPPETPPETQPKIEVTPDVAKDLIEQLTKGQIRAGEETRPEPKPTELEYEGGELPRYTEPAQRPPPEPKPEPPLAAEAAPEQPTVAEPQTAAPSKAEPTPIEDRGAAGGNIGLNAVFDPANYKPAIEFGRHLLSRVKDFASWSAEMLRHFGESVRHHLENIWEFVRSGVEEARTTPMSPDNPSGRLYSFGSFMDPDKVPRREKEPEPFTPEWLRGAVGDIKGNLNRALARKPGTGVAKNPEVEFTTKDGKPITVGATSEQGGKSFDAWMDETEKWLDPDEIAAARRWYRELHDHFVEEFGEKDAKRHMMAWLAAQQNTSPAGALQNVFRVKDRLAGNDTGKLAGLADSKIDSILRGQIPEGGFGAKLSDFVDAGFGKSTRTFVGDDPRGGAPFVADVHTGRDSGHVDSALLSRLVDKANNGDLFLGGKPVKARMLKYKTIMDAGKEVVVPESVRFSTPDGGVTITRDLTGSPSAAQYEGISSWGQRLTEALNKRKFAGGNWTPEEAQAAGWMRILRQYGLPEATVAQAIQQSTHKVSAEVHYGQGNLLPKNYPDLSKLPAETQRRIVSDVMGKAVNDLANIIGGSLRVVSSKVGDGWWEGQASPAIHAFVRGTREAADNLASAIALVAEQAGTLRATFGKGGQNSRAMILRRADGRRLTSEQIADLLDFAKTRGIKELDLVKGIGEFPAPGEEGHIILGLSANKAGRLHDLLADWARERQGSIELDVQNAPAETSFSGNDWQRDPQGKRYHEDIVGRGGSQTIPRILSYRREYLQALESAFEQHAPGVLDPALREERLSKADFPTPEAPPAESRGSAGGNLSTFGAFDPANWKPVIDFGRNLLGHVQDFAEWSTHMLKQFGEHVREHLRNIYDFVKSGFEEAAADRGKPDTATRGRMYTGGFMDPENWKEFTAKKKSESEKVVLPQHFSDLDELTGWLRKSKINSPTKSPIQRVVELPKKAADAWGNGKDAVTHAWGRVATGFRGLLEQYKQPVPESNDFRRVIKLWHFLDTRSALSTHQFQRAIVGKVKDPDRRAGIIAWIQAGGDEGVLQSQLSQVPDRFKGIWEAATKLTDDEKKVARQIAADWQDKLQLGVDAGIIEEGHKNYAPHLWRKVPELPEGSDYNAEFANAGNWGAKIDTRLPFMAFQKSVPTYFDGIMAAGVPRSMDAADLVGVYNQAFNKSVSSRAVVHALMNRRGSDGTPIVKLSGAAEKVEGEKGEAFFVNPHARGDAVSANGRPYRVIDHPALRDWKWVSQTEEGTPIYQKGDALVHPDYYDFLKNTLSKSPIAENKIGRAILKANAFLKASKLTLGTFHLATEAEHAIFHTTAPWLSESDRIDLSKPVDRGLVLGGLELGMHDAAQLFSEGLASNRGLFNKVPVIGKASSRFSDWLFKDYIPQIKMKMARHAYERNVERYGKELTKEQIFELTAMQSNAAFGGLNYRLMGRSPLLMDAMRLMGLAPDFLEARMRFVGQAFKPYGAEQRRALLLMAATTYIGARILNSLFDDDNDAHWAPEDAFSVYHGGRKYSLRTVTADALHMFTDPRAFWYNRASPLVRTLTELSTQRDWRGIKRTWAEQLGDFARWAVPAGTEGVVNKGLEKLGARSDQPETTPTSAALGSLGLVSKKATALSRVYQLAADFNRSSKDPKTLEYQKANDAESRVGSPFRQLDNALDQGDTDKAKKEIKWLTENGRPLAKIREHYQKMNQPFTGPSLNNARERQFIASLTPEQKKLYESARKERQSRREALLRVLQNLPTTNETAVPD